MNRRRVVFLIAASICLSLAQSACSTETYDALTPEVKQLENTSPKRILFVGNSYLYYNDSLHNHVGRIAKASDPDNVDAFKYKSATISGSRLSQHNIDSLLEPGRLGIDVPFELVVLQGGSFEPLTDENRVRFRQSAVEMNEKIRATGAEVALYMTHAYVEPDKRYEPGLINKIEPAYVSVGNEIGALVIPVGLAFERAYEQRPDIVLHMAFDGTHPSLLGTYLASCVVFESIYPELSLDETYDYFGAIDKDDAAFLRGVAGETVKEFFGRE